ncbi:MAG: MFS transporter, partial [Acetobacteraceae bacterium]|nr:MFS transporter [Acetobacteraceae bacterium]
HEIAADLHAQIATLQWVVDLYNLVYAAFILTGGTLADIYGRRFVFVAGSACFAVGSLVCALAPDAATLIIGRGLAGFGAALELPAALAILNVTYPDPAERTHAIAIWGGMNGLAMAIGPTLGGILVDALGWRSLFWVILPVAAAAVWLALRRVPESRDPAGRGLDIRGQLLAIVVLATLALGFIEAPALGWMSPWILLCFLVCLGSMVGFLVSQRHSKTPLVPLSVFQSRPFSASILIAMAMTFGMYGLLFVLPLFFQAIQGSSATIAGVKLLPMSLSFYGVSLFAGRIAGSFGARVLIGGGIALVGAGCFGLSFLSPSATYTLPAVSLLVIGIGLGSITGPIATVAVSNAPAARSGMSSGLVNMGRLIGATIGVAILGVLFGAEAAKAAHDSPTFLHGLRLTFLLGGCAELLGAGVAAVWLRSGSLSTPATQCQRDVQKINGGR